MQGVTALPETSNSFFFYIFFGQKSAFNLTGSVFLRDRIQNNNNEKNGVWTVIPGSR
jgi:hypothetical protein